jgi:hypothetical protein
MTNPVRVMNTPKKRIRLSDLFGVTYIDYRALPIIDRIYSSNTMIIHGGKSNLKPGEPEPFGGALPEEGVHILRKKLYLAGHVRDIFKKGPHFVLIGDNGDIYREFWKKEGRALMDPKGGADLLYVDLDADVYYEPWGEMFGGEPGNFLFVRPKEVPATIPFLLRLGKEDSVVELK